jgi:hypothetical protein
MDDRSYLARNRETRERLRRLVEGLSDSQLAQPVGEERWTVAASLAHCAFWDRFALALWEVYEQQGVKVFPIPVNTTNRAATPQWMALPPREAVRQAVEATEALDRKIETVAPELLEAYVSAGGDPWIYHSYDHRGEHLEEIEHALGAGSAR